MGSVADRLLSTAPSEIVLPTVVLYELEVGIAKSRTPKSTKKNRPIKSRCADIYLTRRMKAEASTSH